MITEIIFTGVCILLSIFIVIMIVKDLYTDSNSTWVEWGILITISLGFIVCLLGQIEFLINLRKVLYPL